MNELSTPEKPRMGSADIAAALRRDILNGVLITHDLREAIFLADEVVVLSGRPATVQYSLKLPDTGPRTLDHLYTNEATETLNVLRDQIRIAREGEEVGP